MGRMVGKKTGFVGAEVGAGGKTCWSGIGQGGKVGAGIGAGGLFLSPNGVLAIFVGADAGWGGPILTM